MKKRLVRLLYRIIGKQNLRSWFFNDYLKKESLDPETVNRLLIHVRDHARQQMFQYPSILNDGYLHIERAIAIIGKFSSARRGLIIDIGAAGGETVAMFAKAFPFLTIHAFEPLHENFERLMTTCGGYKNVVAHKAALGSAPSNVEINVMSRVTASSILESTTDVALGGKRYFEAVRKESVKVLRLDDVLTDELPVHLIKLDVQGFELEVLRGAGDVLSRTTFVLVELQNHDIYKNAPKYYDIDAFVRSRNFELFELIPSIREEWQIKEYDALYINKVWHA